MMADSDASFGELVPYMDDIFFICGAMDNGRVYIAKINGFFGLPMAGFGSFGFVRMDLVHDVDELLEIFSQGGTDSLSPTA